jgi:hypothetical protein
MDEMKTQHEISPIVKNNLREGGDERREIAGKFCILYGRDEDFARVNHKISTGFFS